MWTNDGCLPRDAMVRLIEKEMSALMPAAQELVKREKDLRAQLQIAEQESTDARQKIRRLLLDASEQGFQLQFHKFEI